MLFLPTGVGVSVTCTSNLIAFATGARVASRHWLALRRSEQSEKVMQEATILSITFTPSNICMCMAPSDDQLPA